MTINASDSNRYLKRVCLKILNEVISLMYLGGEFQYLARAHIGNIDCPTLLLRLVLVDVGVCDLFIFTYSLFRLGARARALM